MLRSFPSFRLTAIKLRIFPFALRFEACPEPVEWGERKIPTYWMFGPSWFDKLTTNGFYLMTGSRACNQLERPTFASRKRSPCDPFDYARDRLIPAFYNLTFHPRRRVRERLQASAPAPNSHIMPGSGTVPPPPPTSPVRTAHAGWESSLLPLAWKPVPVWNIHAR